MEIKEIRALAQIMKENGLTQMEIQEEGKSIRMERESAVYAPAAAPVLSVPVMQSPLPCAAEAVPPQPDAKEP